MVMGLTRETSRILVELPQCVSDTVSVWGSNDFGQAKSHKSNLQDEVPCFLGSNSFVGLQEAIGY